MDYWLQLFVSMLMLVFAIGSIIAGLFTAYFGSGKSRAIGGILLLIGLIVALVFYNYSTGDLFGSAEWHWETVKYGISAVIGAVIGALVALGVFLAGIMKA
ncbi:MAG TPA: hypothetical protein ENN54_06235 [Thermoplasmatales archaeon]|nr:hypothetical protein [Candidatus Thermoplasmatota archaeon]MDD5778227.1 hypothetical protein [Candidatus Thermoplasmatota archaeon]HDS59869.1 hypothetical protein [Thermoplasmatales archaeon]